MKTDKLFNLLVLGGALVVANSVSANVPANTELSPLFCGAIDVSKPVEENTCVLNETGQAVVKAGFYCCWGTDCGTAE